MIMEHSGIKLNHSGVSRRRRPLDAAGLSCAQTGRLLFASPVGTPFMPDSPPEPPPPPDRREFLSVQPLRDRLASSLEGESPVGEAPSLADRSQATSEQWLQHFSHRAMAAEFQVYLNLGQHPIGPTAVLEGFTLVDQLEDRFSIFRPHSDLSRVNQLAAATPIPVDSDLFGLLDLAARLHRETSGAFDIATTALSRVWNFLSRTPRVPPAEAIAAALEISGQRHVFLEPSERSVSLRRRGVELNLHSIGKGFAVQKLAEHLHLAGVRDFLIHGGQSSVFAAGSCLPADPDRSGWKVGLTHPIVPEQRIAELLLSNQAIGTSGSARQGLVHQGRRLGHILDPRSGWPASHWLSTTVLHPNPAWADALATAFFVMTEEEVVRYCEYHPEIAAIHFASREPGGRLELRLFRFPAARLEFNERFQYVPVVEVIPPNSTASPASKFAPPLPPFAE
jgi:thiamine biosynthesis lipoprotein